MATRKTDPPAPPTKAALAAAYDAAHEALWHDENGNPVFYTAGPDPADKNP